MSRAATSRRGLVRAVREAEARIKPGASVVNDLRRSEAGLERAMRPELQHRLEELGMRLAGATYQMGGLLMEADTPSKAEEQRIDSIIAAARLDPWKIERLKPMFERHWKRTAQMTLQVLERHDIKPSIQDRIADDIMSRGGKRMGLLDIAGDTKKAMFEVLRVGRELGLNPKKTALLIEHFVPKGRFRIAGKQYRSQMIARTETLSAVREASLQGYKFSRVVEKVMAFDGEEFDEICASRNGEIFTIEEAEQENGNTHPNCVLCWGPA